MIEWGMKETIKEIIERNLTNKGISIYKSVVDGEYKATIVIELSYKDYSIRYLEEYAENDLFTEFLNGILIRKDIKIDGYMSTVYDSISADTIYVDISFYYPIPITDRVTRKSLLNLLSLV